MHMSGTARFTPQALDIVLTQNELLREDDPRNSRWVPDRLLGPWI